MKKISGFIVFCCLAQIAFGQKHSYDLKITHLVGPLYVYESFGTYQGQRYPANAMYLVTDSGVVVFDTPWGETYYQPLLDSIWQKNHKPVIMCLSTHFHDDRTDGLMYYARKGIQTFTTAQTDSLSLLNHNNRAEFLMPRDTVFHVGGETFEVYYPGPGHSADNIVIWFPKEKVLYGGCFIKSTQAKSLGNLEDANVPEWAKSLKRLQKKFPKPNYIIVGHEDWTDQRSIIHTIDMVKANLKQHKH